MAAATTSAAAQAPAPIDYSKATDGTGVIALDPWLEPFAPALRERYGVDAYWVKRINASEGGLEAFSRSYRKMGFQIDPTTQAVTYTEWAPNAVQASLVGDFNNFIGNNFPRARGGRECAWSDGNERDASSTESLRDHFGV